MPRTNNLSRTQERRFNSTLKYQRLFLFKGCRDALGMEIGAISDSQISASSGYKKPSAHAASQGRLNFQETSDKAGAWVAATNDVNQWLQVDLYQLTKVTRVATQGRNFRSQWPWGSHSQWVTKYNLLYSDDDETFQYYMEQGQTTDKVKILRFANL